MKYSVLFLAFLTVLLKVNCENEYENIPISREEFDNLKELVKSQLVVNQKLQSELNLQRSIIKNFQMTISKQAEKIKNCNNLEASEFMENQTKKKGILSNTLYIYTNIYSVFFRER